MGSAKPRARGRETTCHRSERLQDRKKLRLEHRKLGETEAQDHVMSHSVIVQEDLVLAGLFNGSRAFVGHLKAGIQAN